MQIPRREQRQRNLLSGGSPDAPGWLDFGQRVLISAGTRLRSWQLRGVGEIGIIVLDFNGALKFAAFFKNSAEARGDPFPGLATFTQGTQSIMAGGV